MTHAYDDRRRAQRCARTGDRPRANAHAAPRAAGYVDQTARERAFAKKKAKTARAWTRTRNTAEQRSARRAREHIHARATEVVPGMGEEDQSNATGRQGSRNANGNMRADGRTTVGTGRSE
jgi:hypothetical protein